MPCLSVERAHNALIVALAACAASIAPPAAAAPVEGIYSLSREPIAPIGGVLLLPLGAQRPGDQWPASIPLTLADGRTIDGTVIWIAPRERDPVARRRWTDEAVRFDVRPVRADDTTSRTTPGTTSRTTPGAPYLVARLPRDGAGAIGLGGQTLRPVWRDPSFRYTLTPLPGPDRPRLPFAASPDRPEPDAPFAYWRWVLLADHLDHQPPGTDHFDAIEALVAEHYASLWRVALGRLGEHSRSAAQTCRDMLTRICTDRPHHFAAWVAPPAEVSLLLTGLLDFRKEPEAVVRDALAWVDTRRLVAAWSEAEDDDHVRVAVVNRGFLPVVLRVAWEQRGEAPMNVELPPGELTRVIVDRPPPPPPTPLELVDPGDRQHVLAMRTGAQTVRIVFGPRVVTARPPGAVLPVFRPALTLNDVESERLQPLPDPFSTLAHLRRREGRWELFVDARRPAPAGGIPVAAEPLESFTHADQIIGVEAVTITVGPAASPTAVLAIPESGRHRLLSGHDDGRLAVHRRSWGDRWYCRVVLPDAWLDGATVRIGCRRSHGDGDAVETSPATSAPWCQDPGRLLVELGSWDR